MEQKELSGVEYAKKLSRLYLHASGLGNELATKWARRLGFEEKRGLPAARQLRIAASELNAPENEENS